MSNICKGVRDFLVADADILAEFSTRVYRHRAPMETNLPYILVEKIGATRVYNLTTQFPLAQSTVQVDVYVSKPNQVSTLGEHVRNRLSGYRGSMGNEVIQGCTCIRDNDLTEEPNDGSDDWNFRRSFDYLITHSEAVPTNS